jgi:hypothetical protein
LRGSWQRSKPWFQGPASSDLNHFLTKKTTFSKILKVGQGNHLPRIHRHRSPALHPVRWFCSEHTLEEVGQSLAVTRERIRQIEAKARNLRHPSRSRKLRAFMDGVKD